jgi:hypothetical protein
MKNMMIAILAMLPMVAMASSGIDIQDCAKMGVGIDTLVSPASKNSRAFYNGAVQVYNVDVEEPAARSAGLAIVMPFPAGDGPGASCTAVGLFSGIDVTKAKSSYDETRGLLLTIPYGIYDPETGRTSPSSTPVKIRINRVKGSVTLE